MDYTSKEKTMTRCDTSFKQILNAQRPVVTSLCQLSHLKECVNNFYYIGTDEIPGILQ